MFWGNVKMKYEYNSKFKVGDKLYYIALELKQIVVIPCIVDSVCFTNLGVKYFVDNINDEVTEFELVKREDKNELISRIKMLSEELC